MRVSITPIVLFSVFFVTSCSNNNRLFEETTSEAPMLKSVRFLALENERNLIEDVECDIIGDSIVECWIPHLVKDKLLRAEISAVGGVYLDGKKYSVSCEYDFSKSRELSVRLGDEQKNYKCFVHSYTGLPVVWIETDGRRDIESKEYYMRATFRLQEDLTTRAAGEVVETVVNIKGRGNNTWAVMPKKPYRLKFDTKISLLDEPADKSWVLLANYFDKSLIRNSVVFYIGSLSRLNYTTRSHFVELMLNGMYNGTYQLTEKIKLSKHRLYPGEDGYLMEFDRYSPTESDARYFKTEHLYWPVNIKDPNIEYDDEDYTYVKNFFIKAEDALYSEHFLDPNEGWRNYLDEDSFVDWYLISEIAKSCENWHLLGYCNMSKGGKLYMGPLWDYDKSFGNWQRRNDSDYAGVEEYTGFWVKNCDWFGRLFEDPTFVKNVKSRFLYFYSHKDDIMEHINADAIYLKRSVVENNNRWDVLYRLNSYDPHDNDIWGSYYNEIQYLKNWIDNRFEWLRVEFENM